MGNSEIVRALFGAFEAGDMEAAAGYLDEGFRFNGPVPEPIGKDQWVGPQAAMRAGIPDWSFNLSDVQTDGDVVRTAVQVTGTHTGELDLSPIGMPVVPATGRSVSNPVEHPEVTVRDGKITGVHVGDVGPEGGVGGILKQLGVAPPPPPA